jgi:hypothetical protein
LHDGFPLVDAVTQQNRNKQKRNLVRSTRPDWQAGHCAIDAVFVLARRRQRESGFEK